MTEAKKPMAKKRVMSITSPEEKAKAFVEVERKKESQTCEDSSKIHISKEMARLDAVTLELKKNIDHLSRELNKQQIIYSTKFSEIEEILKESWSYRIRNWFGF